MRYYDLVQDKKLKKAAEVLGFHQIFSHDDLRTVSSDRYQEILKNVRKGTVIIDPLNERKTLLDPVLAKKIAHKNAGVALTLQSVAEREGLRRAGWIHSMILTVRICKKYGAEVIIVSNAPGPAGLKNPRMLEAFGHTLGLTRPQAKWACSHAWEKVLKG